MKFVAAFLVLLAVSSSAYEWKAMDKNAALPTNCVVGGNEESDNYKGLLYIGRKQIDNELTIGKIIGSWKVGYFPKDGVEHTFDSYEILCGDEKFHWVPKLGPQDNAIAGGKAKNDEPFYVCRAPFSTGKFPGKLYKPTDCCYISNYGKEHCVTSYEVLITAGTFFHGGANVTYFRK